MEVEFNFRIHPEYLLVVSNGQIKDAVDEIEYGQFIINAAKKEERKRLLLDERKLEIKLTKPVDISVMGWVSKAAKEGYIEKIATVSKSEPNSALSDLYSQLHLVSKNFKSVRAAEKWIAL